MSLFLRYISFLFLICAGDIKTIKTDHNFRYSHTDIFENETPGSLPQYWAETYGQKSWIAKKEAGNTYLTQQSMQEKPSVAYLHLFERNPVFKGKLKIVESKKTGKMSFLLRYNAEGAWVRIKYYPEKQLFVLTEQEGPGQKEHRMGEASYHLGSAWHTFDIVMDSPNISLRINGKEILTSKELKHRTFGKIGFETTNCLIGVDDITYRGNEGRPNKSIVQGEIRIPLDSSTMNSGGRPFWGLHLGVLQQNESGLLGIVGFRDHKARNSDNNLYPYCTIRSSNNGLTWKGTTLAERQWLVSVEGDSIKGIWPNITQINNGHILMGYNSRLKKNTAYFSGDGGRTWHRRGSLIVDEELENVYAGHPWQRFMMTMPGKLSANSQGLFYPTTRVLWNSKDRGHNWGYLFVFHKGNETWNPRSQEHQVIEISKDTLAVYSRDDGAREAKPESMTLVKRLSTDGGQSWSEYKIDNTPFISSKCAFSIKKDPYQENTVWIFWTYNNKHDEPSVNNQPRTRAGLAVSHDNAKTWKYVMDVDDWGFPDPDITDFQNNKEQPRYLQKDNRFTNLALWVTPDYLHLTMRRRYRLGKEKLEDFCVFYTRVDKSKIEIYPEFPGTRY